PLLVLLQAVDAADGGGLARAGRPAQDDTLARLHAEVGVLEHVELAVPLVHALQQDHRIGAGLLVDFTHNSLLSRSWFRIWRAGARQSENIRGSGMYGCT